LIIALIATPARMKDSRYWAFNQNFRVKHEDYLQFSPSFFSESLQEHCWVVRYSVHYQE